MHASSRYKASSSDASPLSVEIGIGLKPRHLRPPRETRGAATRGSRKQRCGRNGKRR